MSKPYAIAQAEISPTEITRLFVHPLQGSDRATGAEDAPLQTITQALLLASPGTTIVLAPGRYSRDGGEQFPLQILDGVTLQGSPDDYGDGVIIQGGGTFMSATAGRQNAAAIASGSAVISGLTLSNDRGHGLWIEQGAPTVTSCLFWGSQHGVAIGGDSRPTVRHNRFYQNRGSGLSIGGTAAPIIQTNRIEETGYGLTISEQAAPQLRENHIRGNRSGVLIQAQARPQLRGNRILSNREDGVVTIAQAQPDLGLQGQPGGNQFSGNGRYDINAQASNQIIAAAGNEFLTGSPVARTSGRVDFSGVVAAVPSAIATSAGQHPQTLVPAAATTSNEALRDETPGEAIALPVALPPIAPTRAQNPPARPGFNPIAGLSQSPSPAAALSSPAPQPNPLQAALPQRPNSPPPRRQPSDDLLAVPTAQVPVGYVGGLSRISAASVGGARLTPRYRVVVEADSAQAQAVVQAIAPGAFITRVNGRAVMQAGAYQRVENANQMQQQLASRGLRAAVQQMQ